jgi:hypothetical protein
MTSSFLLPRRTLGKQGAPFTRRSRSQRAALSLATAAKLASLLALASVAAGCGPVDLSAPGALGKGYFTYACPADTDCPRTSSEGEFPKAMATGAPFQLTFCEPEGDWVPTCDETTGRAPFDVEPAAPGLVTKDAATGVFRGQREVVTSLLALHENKLIDYLNVTFRDAKSLSFAADPGVGGGSIMKEGGAIPAGSILRHRGGKISVSPVDVAGERLGGGFRYHWVSADPAIVQIVSGADTRVPELWGEELGRTHLTVTVEGADLVGEVEVTVVDDPGKSPAPDPGTPAGSPDAGGP